MPSVHIDFELVRSVYSGKPGCACGCRGKYTYTSKYRDEQSKSRGYAVTDDEVSDRGAKIKLQKMRDMFEAGQFDPKSLQISASYLSFEAADNSRVYTVYWRK